MNEIINNYIGKDCLITSINSNIIGVIKQVKDNWVLLETKSGQNDAINLEYIIRVREYPKNKKGNKKTVIFD